MRFALVALFLLFSLSYGNSSSVNTNSNTSTYSPNAKYSVEDIINMTLQSHPTIKMNRAIIQGSDSQVQGARWGYYPTPSISSYQTQNNIFGATISIDQPIFTGGKLDAAYDAALAGKKSSEYGLEESAYTVIETLLEQLKLYLQGANGYQVLLEGQKQLLILKGMVDRRVAAGVSPKADNELLMARIYQIDTDLNLAKTKRDTALAQIEILTGRPFDGKLTLDESAPIVNGDVGSILDQTMNSHPLLKKYDAQIELAKAETDRSKSSIWPNLVLKAQQNFGSSSLTTDIKADNSPFVYLSLQAAPGAGLSSLSAVEGAKAKILQVEQEKLVAKQTLTNKIMYAYNDYQSASKRIDTQSKSVGSSQRVFASYTRLFLAGKRQWLDLVNSSREVTQNEISYSDVKVSMIISAYQLALYRGEINPLGTPRVVEKSKPIENPDSILNNKYVQSAYSHSLAKDIKQRIEEPKETKSATKDSKIDGYFVELEESSDITLATALKNSSVPTQIKDNKVIVGPYPSPADAFNAIYSVQKTLKEKTNNQEMKENR